MLASLACLALLSPLQGLPTENPLPRRGTLGAGFSPLPPDQAAPLGLQPGEGVVAQAPSPGLTAAKAGIQAGDVLVRLNGQPVRAQGLGETVRRLPSGQTVTFRILRAGKPMELSAPLSERPRDPGTQAYDVAYSHVVSNGQRMRTIITTPKKPGRQPGFLFIQGFSPVSYDFTLATADGSVTSLDGPLLRAVAESNFVTLRIEKPGVGDSEGGPFAEMDYTTELDIYRQALKQLKGHPSVDPDNVFIFGHSMGGAFGPMVASENKVKGIATFGTAARTWHEYFLDITRYQSLLAGATEEQVDESVRQTSRLISLLFHENMSVADVKKAHPELSQLADQMMPGGMFSGKTLEFWRQLGKINFPAYWAKSGARVLAAHGAVDFVSYPSCHQLIANAVNRANPGFGKFVSVPATDHVFHRFETERESQANFTRGKWNNRFTEILIEWMKECMEAK